MRIHPLIWSNVEYQENPIWDWQKLVLIAEWSFYTQPHNSGGVLWFHVGHPCVCPSVRFSFPDDHLSKHQWIFTKLGLFVDIVEIWFGIANGQISSNFTELSARDTPIFSFPDNNE